MIYVCELTIPANTPKETPLRQTYPITAGLITQIAVHWPWGPGNLCGVQLRHVSFQFWPLSPTRWFNSTTRDLVFSESHLVTEDDPRLDLDGYNLDDTFPHTVTVYVEVSRPGEVSMYSGLWASPGSEVVYGPDTD